MEDNNPGRNYDQSREVYYTPQTSGQALHQYQQEMEFPADFLEPSDSQNYAAGVSNTQSIGYALTGYQPLPNAHFVEQPSQSRYVQVQQPSQLCGEEGYQWPTSYYCGSDIPYAGSEEIVGDMQAYEDPMLSQHVVSSNPFEEEEDDDPSFRNEQFQRPYPSQTRNRVHLDESDFEFSEPAYYTSQQVQGIQQPSVSRVNVTTTATLPYKPTAEDLRRRREVKQMELRRKPMPSVISVDETASRAREQANLRYGTPEGWRCVNKWLKQAIERDDRDRILQLLDQLKATDVSVDLLTQADTPKLVRELWKTHSNKKINQVANELYVLWKNRASNDLKMKKAKNQSKDKELKPKVAKVKGDQAAKKDPEPVVAHQQTNVNLLDQLTEAMDKEARQDSKSPPLPSTASTEPKKPRVKAKVKISKSRMTGLEEDAAPIEKTVKKEGTKKVILQKDVPKRSFAPSDSFMAAFDAVEAKKPPKKKPRIVVPKGDTAAPQKQNSTEVEMEEQRSTKPGPLDILPPSPTPLPSREELAQLAESRRLNSGIMRTVPLTPAEKRIRRIRFTDDHGAAPLVQIKFFEVADGERVNVSKLSPNDMKHLEMKREHEDLNRMKQQFPLPGLSIRDEPEKSSTSFAEWNEQRLANTSWRSGNAERGIRMLPLLYDHPFIRGRSSTLGEVEDARERNSMAAFVDPRVKMSIVNEDGDQDLIQRAEQALRRFEDNPNRRRFVVNAERGRGAACPPPGSALQLPLPPTVLHDDTADVKVPTLPGLPALPNLPGLPTVQRDPPTEKTVEPVDGFGPKKDDYEPLPPEVLSILDSVRRTQVPPTSVSDALADSLNESIRFNSSAETERVEAIKPIGEVHERINAGPQVEEPKDHDFRAPQGPHADRDLRNEVGPSFQPVVPGAVPIQGVQMDSDMRSLNPSEQGPESEKPVVTQDTLTALAVLAGKTSSIVGNLDLAAILNQVDSASRPQNAGAECSAGLSPHMMDPTAQFGGPSMKQEPNSFPPFNNPLPHQYGQVFHGGAPPPFGQPRFPGPPPQFGGQRMGRGGYFPPQQQFRPPRPPLPCKFYQNGSCTFAENCRNLHGQEPTEGLRRLQQNAQQPPNMPPGNFPPPQGPPFSMRNDGPDYDPRPFEEHDGRGRGRGFGRGGGRNFDDRRGRGARRMSPQRRFDRRDDKDGDRRRRRRRSISRSPSPRRRRYRSTSRSRSRSPIPSSSSSNARSHERSPPRRRRDRSRSPPAAPTDRSRERSPPPAPTETSATSVEQQRPVAVQDA